LRRERLLLMIGLLLASSALHAQERRPTRGERLALEGRCAEAAPELEREIELVPAPESARVAWRLGQCSLRAHSYAHATAVLERALAIDPTLAEANLDLARARYHSGDLDGADAALRAGESLSGEAVWQLYRGMVDLGRGDATAAVAALQRAVDINAATFRTRADAEAVEPAASYYLGIALRAAGEEESARERLDEVADAWAGTAWGNEANRALGRTTGRRAWLNLGVGLGYNDNVVLSGHETPLPEEISDQSDFFAALIARGGIDLAHWGASSLGALASYRGRIHFDREDLRQFDSHFPTASLWLDRALRSDTHARLRYDFGYAWVDSDPYLISNGGRFSLIHAWSARSATELFGKSFVEDYRLSSSDVPDGLGAPGGACGPLPPPYTVCGPRLLNEHDARDLDGYGAGAGITQAWTLPIGLPPLADPALTGGYEYTYFESDGREYSHQAHRVFAGLGFALPWSLGLDLEGSYAYRAFRHPTSFPDREDLLRASPSAADPVSRQYFLRDSPRREHRIGFDTRLSVPLAEPFSLSLLYSYRDNLSSADVFDYDQHVVGFLLNVNLARAL
jgi:tetratricopeptide (TPR) repeat protein